MSGRHAKAWNPDDDPTDLEALSAATDGYLRWGDTVNRLALEVAIRAYAEALS